MLAPSLAARIAMARPMPRLPPVMKSVLPLSEAIPQGPFVVGSDVGVKQSREQADPASNASRGRAPSPAPRPAGRHSAGTEAGQRRAETAAGTSGHGRSAQA